MSPPLQPRPQWSLTPRRVFAGVAAAAVAIALAAAAIGYPLDGYERTGIRRLLAYRLILEGKMAGRLDLKPGARLGSDRVQLRLAGANESFDISKDTPLDPQLQAGLQKIVGARHPSYRAALLDISDPLQPRFAAVEPDLGYIPGSVGKLMVLTGLFDQLRKRFPSDVQARARFLRETQVTADDWVLPNHHAIPVVSEDLKSVTHRSVRVGDRFSLWEWVDHMVSPSSNAAATMVWKQVLLMDAFGPDYPPPPQQAADFLNNTPKLELADRAVEVIERPLREAGLDTDNLRIGTFFTRNASRAIPGRGSHCTPRQLLRWLVKLEQGKLIDSWSSLEMKRLTYFTRRRYRYASSPALDKSAVFFKSGSLFRCKPEPDFQCVQYKGNVENLMHSVAIVESPSRSGGPDKVYLVSVMSNVLKVNSAAEHQQIASEIERLVNP